MIKKNDDETHMI